jgi:hypothetical protein
VATWVTKSEIDQVKNGFRAVGGYIIGFFTMGMLVCGIMTLRFPKSYESPLPSLGLPPLWVGSLYIVAATVILWTTMHRWAKSLSGLFTYSVFGALLAVAAGGWHPPIKSLQLSRTGCAIEGLLFAACSVLTYRFKTAEVNTIDRLAILAAILCFTYGAMLQSSLAGFWMMGAMITAFGAAAGIDFFRKQQARKAHHRKCFWASLKGDAK